MQRKLSEISEIPKILSSTLATVSQTFDKLMPGALDNSKRSNMNAADRQICEFQQPNRKFSYDEDAIDYALNDNNDDDDNDEYAISQNDTENSADYEYNEIERDLHKLTKKLRDLTPESDYASSESDNDSNDYNIVDDDDDDENTSDDNVDEENFNDTEKTNDADDFLTTTFTWRMRKLPKLLLNDEPQNENGSDEEEIESNSTNDNMELSVKLPAPKAEKMEKSKPLELAWPWADRTKIIYKQSTCHLVPRKSGIIEKSKQLLAKQHLFDKV